MNSSDLLFAVSNSVRERRCRRLDGCWRNEDRIQSKAAESQDEQSSENRPRTFHRH